MRHLVYNEYQKYQKWKADGNRYDKDDLVLELIRSKKRLLSKRNPLFDSVYLDVCLHVMSFLTFGYMCKFTIVFLLHRRFKTSHTLRFTLSAELLGHQNFVGFALATPHR
jgi:hypothetical protein